MVYPGAVHSRFEHSLGVYWLAGEAVHTIKAHQVGTRHNTLVLPILNAIILSNSLYSHDILVGLGDQH